MIEIGLSKEEMDFVTEALTIGAGNAATALSQMLGCDVALSGPKVRFLSPEEVPSIFEDQSLQAIVSKVGFVGDMKGESYYIVKEVDVRELVHLIEKTFPVDEKADIAEVSIIGETANIITGVYFSALGNFCGLNVNQTIPVVTLTTLQAQTDEFKGIGYQLKGMELIAILNELTVAERRITTYLLLALSDEALKILSLKITEARRRLEIKELEEKVVQRTLEFHAVVETAGDAIISMKPPGEIYLWNRKAEEMLGYSADEADGKEIHSLIIPERYREKAKDGLKRFFQTGAGPLVGKTIEIEALRKDGTEFPVELTVSAMNIRGEWHTTGIVRDIRERKKAEEALHEGEERFRATFNQAAVGIAHVATDGHWLLVNQKLCDIVGYSHPELMDRTFKDITYPDDIEADLEYLRRTLANEIQTFSREKRYIRKDGSLVWINLTTALVRNSSGEPQYFISVIEEITDRKKAENELKDRLDELELFHRVTVDREIRMHEVMEENEGLKKRVEEMEKKLRKG